MNKGAAIFICILLFSLSACSSPEQKKAKHMERGLKYFNDAKYNEAVIEFKNVVKLSPKDGKGRIFHYFSRKNQLMKIQSKK